MTIIPIFIYREKNLIKKSEKKLNESVNGEK